MESNMIEDLGMIGVKPNGAKYRVYKVKCEDCDKEWTCQRDNWTQRKTNKCASCACHLKTHGKSKNNPLYIRWVGMNQRCAEKYSKGGYKDVYVCDEWKDFEAFESWALSNGYSPELELDKDKICFERDISPKYYGPDTCQWLDRTENRTRAWETT
jgi:ribosomal protein S27E